MTEDSITKSIEEGRSARLRKQLRGLGDLVIELLFGKRPDTQREVVTPSKSWHYGLGNGTTMPAKDVSSYSVCPDIAKDWPFIDD